MGTVRAADRRFQQVGSQVAQRTAFKITALKQQPMDLVGDRDRDALRSFENSVHSGVTRLGVLRLHGEDVEELQF